MTGLQLTRRQYYALCTMVLLSPLLHLVPRKTTAEAGCGGWLCALAALVPLLLFAWMLEGILHRGRPGEGIGEITLRALGPVAGRVLLGVYALWFLLYSAFALRIGAERFIEAVFPLSRPWPFVVTILAMAVCGALGSTKALFRASEIFLPLLMLVLALVLVFAVPGLNVNNLLPVTAQDLPGVARSGLTVFGIGAAVLFFGAFTGGRTPPAPGRGRAAVWWCVRMCVLVTLLSAFAIGILGAELTAKLTHPFFTMLRNVSLFHAVERFGALVIGLWVLPDFVLVSMLLTLAVNCLRAACSRDGRLFAQKNPPALVLLETLAAIMTHGGKPQPELVDAFLELREMVALGWFRWTGRNPKTEQMRHLYGLLERMEAIAYAPDGEKDNPEFLDLVNQFLVCMFAESDNMIFRVLLRSSRELAHVTYYIVAYTLDTQELCKTYRTVLDGLTSGHASEAIDYWCGWSDRVTVQYREALLQLGSE